MKFASCVTNMAIPCAVVLLSSCGTVDPAYKRPAVDVPQAYKEQQGWKSIRPLDGIDRGAWWAIYHDSLLDQLERQIDVSNQNVKAAEAAFRQAHAAIEAARAGLFPTLNVSGGAQRSGTKSSSTTQASRVGASYDVALGASWEPDVWGKIRHIIEATTANAQASAADLADARLSMQATLAVDYFELRVRDEVKQLLDQTIVAYTKTLHITQAQYASGFVAKADLITAETQLKTVQAQAINIGVLRAQLEHAIAVLIGTPPAEFAIAPLPLMVEVPDIPTGLPSALLERNPAIAAAEYSIMSANAQIGVALSAYYPDITLSASYGFASTALGALVTADSALWSFGAAVAQTLYDAGARRAQVAEAQAVYEQNVAKYRQTVLNTFQQVEDQLAALRILEQQAEVQNQAVQLAREAVELTIIEYQAGTVPYTSVVTAQATELNDEQAALTVRENRLVASVALIEALGGGWNTAQLSSGTEMKSS